MAMVTCHECKAQISSEAKACPSCGAKPKKKHGLLTWLAVAMVGGIAFQAVIRETGDAPPAATAAKPAAAAAAAGTKDTITKILNGPPSKEGVDLLAKLLGIHCRNVDAHLNYVEVMQKKEKGGTGIYCKHDFYNQYALSGGKRGPELERWINEYREYLVKQKVTRVGFWGTGEYASGTWFDLKQP